MSNQVILPCPDSVIDAAYWIPLPRLLRIALIIDDRHQAVLEVEITNDGIRAVTMGVYQGQKLIQHLDGSNWPLERLLADIGRRPEDLVDEAKKIAQKAWRVHPKRIEDLD